MTAERHTGPTTGAKPSTVRRLARWLGVAVFAVLALFVAGAVLVALAVRAAEDQQALMGWAQAAGMIRGWGLIVQALVVFAIVQFWPALVRAGQRRGIVQEHEFERVLQLRMKVLIVGFAYLLLIPIGPGTLWHLFF